MQTRKHTKLVHEGNYAAEIEIEIIDSENSWSPYITLEDALKLDKVRELLKENKIAEAKKFGNVYILKPVAA